MCSLSNITELIVSALKDFTMWLNEWMKWIANSVESLYKICNWISKLFQKTCEILSLLKLFKNNSHGISCLLKICHDWKIYFSAKIVKIELLWLFSIALYQQQPMLMKLNLNFQDINIFWAVFCDLPACCEPHCLWCFSATSPSITVLAEEQFAKQTGLHWRADQTAGGMSESK